MTERLILHNQELEHAALPAMAALREIAAPQWEQHIWRFIQEWLSDKDQFEAQSSGSTGPPKQIMLSRNGMIASAKITAQHFHLPHGTKALLCLPAQYISGKMMLVRTFVNGWNLHWTEPNSNPLHNIADDEFDFCAMTPAQVSASLESNPEAFGRIKQVIIGGAPITQALEQKLLRCNNLIYHTYGMTETISHVAIRPVNGTKASKSYFALPGVKLSTDQRNCLRIEAPHLEVGIIQTNDIVQLSSPFSFQYLGRIDHVINSGGVKIHPEKIENAIAHLLNTPYFIGSEVDDLYGEKVVLYIEAEQLNKSEINRLLSTIKLFVPKYEVPKKVICVPVFEYTPSGKLIRKKYLV